MDAAAGRVARIHGAAVIVITVERRSAGAGTRLTDINGRADIAVIAARSVGSRRIGAGSGSGIARSGNVTLVGSCADHEVEACTNASLARICVCAGVAVIARGPIRLRRVRADACRRVADTDVMTLVKGGADDRVGAGARARLTGVGLRAGVAVVARASIRGIRIRAETRSRVASPRDMALVRSCADHGVGACTGSVLAGVCPRAGVAVVTRSSVVHVTAARHAVAEIVGANVVVFTKRVPTIVHGAVAVVIDAVTHFHQTGADRVIRIVAVGVVGNVASRDRAVA